MTSAGRGRGTTWLLLAGATCVGALATRSAAARDRVSAALAYSADDPAGACPSEVELRRKVAARLGYDPFRADASWVFRIRIDARRRPRAEIETRQGNEAGRHRVLDEPTCEALAETIASTVAIAIDPVAAEPDGTRGTDVAPGGAPATNDAPAVNAAPTTPAATTASPPSDPRRASRGPSPTEASDGALPPSTEASGLVPFVHLDGLVSFGRTAGAAIGGRGAFGVARGAASLAVEAQGEATPGAVRLTPLDDVTFSAFSGALVPCGRISIAELCGVLSLGSLQARAHDVTRPTLKGTFFGAVGARLGLAVPVGRTLTLRANGEMALPLVRTTFGIAGAPVWTASAVQGALAIGAELRFP